MTTDKPKYKVLFARVPEKEFKDIKIACARMGISMQEIIRLGTKHFIQEVYKEQKKK
jgi:hypothetical protein